MGGGDEEMMKTDWKYFLEVLVLYSGNSEIQQLELFAEKKKKNSVCKSCSSWKTLVTNFKVVSPVIQR